MEFKEVYYCKNCQLWHEINPADSLNGCPKCKAELKYVPVKHDIYSSMSSEEKKKFQSEYLASPQEVEMMTSTTSSNENENQDCSNAGSDDHLPGCLSSIGRYAIVLLVSIAFFYAVTGFNRWFTAKNNFQKNAEFHLNTVIESGSELPVGEYVDLEVRWVLGPYATGTQSRTLSEYNLSATVKETNYYYVILENETLISVATANDSEKLKLNRMSDWLLESDGFPADGETFLLRGNLIKMPNGELMDLYQKHAEDIFGVPNDSPSLQKIILDTDAGRERGETLASGIVVVFIVAVVCFVLYKRKKKNVNMYTDN